MKRISPLFLFLLLIAACAAPATPAFDLSATLEPPAPEPAAAPVQKDTAPPPFVPVPHGTPLPEEIDAPLVESPSIIFIEMQDEVYGWAVTEKQVVRTNDGGASWYNVTPPGLTETGYSVFTNFLDVSHAWVQAADPKNYPNGGTLYRTTDGGATWDSFPTPFSAGDLEFVDANNGWILADLGAGAGSMAVSVFQTNNGGARWERVYTNDPNLENAGDSLPLGGIKVLLAPLDMQTAWIGGVIYAPGSVYLFRTDDAGLSWFSIHLPLPDETRSGELAVEKLRFVSRTQGFLALRATSITVNTLLFATDDGGYSWKPLPGMLPGAGMLEIPSAQEMVYYSGGRFHVTKDAGNTFNAVAPGIAFGDSLADMSFVNSLTGWAVVTRPINRRALYKTTDGGGTWIPLIP
jgi:photosystem II stability/assembly factor-like uncharacterized protein